MDFKKSVQGLRIFVGAKAFAKSREFYKALGFEEEWADECLALFRVGEFRFFLQDYYVAEWVDNTMLDLRVASVDEFWNWLKDLKLTESFEEPVRVGSPQTDANGIRRGNFVDPSGILWHFSQNAE